MMRAYFGILMFCLSFYSCHRKTEAVLQPPIRQQQDSLVIVAETAPDSLAVVDEPIIEDTIEQVIVLASLQKTGCYGDCPTYEVQLFSDGRLSWNGKSHVEMLGQFVAWTDSTFYKALFDKAQETGYFSLADQYPVDGHFLPDLPSTVTYLRAGGEEKTIRNNFKSPKSLRGFEAFFEQLVLSQEFEPIHVSD